MEILHLWMADSLFSRAIWFDLYSFLAHRGLSFAMKMHKQLCHGEGWVLAWCFALKGIISSWHGSGFSFKWFLEADRTCYECGLAIFVFLDEGLTETRLFVMQSRCYKTQRGWKECAGSWHSDLNRVASSSRNSSILTCESCEFDRPHFGESSESPGAWGLG